MAKRVAIVQSNYIPWKGYFDLIASVDEFILYDDMQYTRRDWRNRNQIKTADGRQWLTVPVKVTGRYHQRIRETEIDGEEWAAQHWKSLRHAYGRASNFRTEAPWVEQLYLEKSVSLLSSLNRRWIEAICRKLEIQTRISNSWDYPLSEGKSERLANLCLQAGASTYVSGPAARDYLVESVFEERGVQVEWFSYENYPEYPQLWGAFEHGVTILDLIFNCGAESRRHMLLARR